MTSLKFTVDGVLPNGERTYRLEIGGEVVRERLTLDEVVEAINRRDEESLGRRHTPARQAVTGPEVIR